MASAVRAVIGGGGENRRKPHLPDVYTAAHSTEEVRASLTPDAMRIDAERNALEI